MAMQKKGGLGKGLDALFTVTPVEEEVEKSEQNGFAKMLKLVDVEPNRNQARKTFDQESLNELANSIKTYGVIQPIIVNKKQGFYEIVAGERRWRASKIAGLTEIPAIIREDEDERKSQEISLIENVQREDLNAYEKALGIRQLIDDYNLTQQEVADALGKSRSSIANTVRLLNLDYRVLNFIQEGKLTESHCRPLLAIQDRTEQYKLAVKMIEMGSTVQDINESMQIRKKAPKKRENKYQAIYKDIENQFQGFFGSKVRLDAGKQKGRIVIEYSSNQDLERMLELIKKEK